jgi:hypothetical protein
VTTVARIHYEIPDELHREAKAAAAMRGVTLKDYVIDALQEAVTNANEVARRRNRGGRTAGEAE